MLNNYPVNRTDFRIVRGVQNEILFFIRNLDRNPASVANVQTVTINIVDQKSATLIMTRNLTLVDAPTALYMLTVLPSETAGWETGPLRWSLSITRTDGSTVMLWTDMNYGPYGTLEVSEGPVPGPVPPQVLDPSTFVLRDGGAYSSALIGPAQLGYAHGLRTFAIYPTDFTGSVEIDGSLQSQPSSDEDWYVISTTTYNAIAAVTPIDVTGSHLWLRVLVRTTSGTLTQILYS